nr:hypothetical protein [Rhodococcus sp. MTM3W5.2]
MCARDSIPAHIGDCLVCATASGGSPTAAVMKYSTAFPRRSSAVKVASRSR